MTIFKPPRILTMQFLRFTMTGKKIGKYIQFPKTFNLRVFVSENVDSGLPKEEQTNHIYSLYGIIVHAGRSTRAGHYYSFVKKNNKWYMCNDESISEVRNIDQVLKQNAYMLIYKYHIKNTKKSPAKKAKEDMPAPAPVQTPTMELNLARAKSLSAEIVESHQKKNNGEMPLSGFFEGKEDVNSDEEEEKLVTKPAMTKKEEQNFTELDYIMDNFEDVDFDGFKNLDFMKNLSVMSLNDDIGTPELKTYISKTIMKRKAQQLGDASKRVKLNESSSSESPSLTKQNSSTQPSLTKTTTKKSKRNSKAKIKKPSNFPKPSKSSKSPKSEEQKAPSPSPPKSLLKEETDIKKYLAKKREQKAKRKLSKELNLPTQSEIVHKTGSDKYKGKNNRRRGKRVNKKAKAVVKKSKAKGTTEGKFDSLVQKILSSK